MFNNQTKMSRASFEKRNVFVRFYGNKMLKIILTWKRA